MIEPDLTCECNRCKKRLSLIYHTTIPIKTVSESNTKEHWSKSSKRHNTQKKRIKMQFLVDRPILIKPCTITLCRIAPRSLDYDNLVTSFKWIKDAISELFNPGLSPGQADNDSELYWVYDQKKGGPKQYAISITLEK